MSIQIQFTGHIGKSAEIKTTANGKTYTNLTVASTPRKKVNGEWADGETVWFNVTYWGSVPEIVYQKGAKVIVVGTLETKSYEKDGVEKKSLIVTAESLGVAIKPQVETQSNFSQPAFSNTPAVEDMPF
jgi:single-strand DNA-binding protein